MEIIHFNFLAFEVCEDKTQENGTQHSFKISPQLL